MKRFIAIMAFLALAACGPEWNCFGPTVAELEEWRKQEVFYRFGSDHDGTHVGFIATQRQVYDELAKREHIPNREEGKKDRRKQAKVRHGQNKGKDR